MLPQLGTMVLLFGTLWCLALVDVPVWLLVSGAFVMAWAGRVGIRRMMKDWAGPADRIGWLVLSGERIRLESAPPREYPVRALTHLHIASNHIQGRPMRYKDILRNGLGTLSVATATERMDAKFLIRTKEEHRALIEVLKAWYAAGVPVSESTASSRSAVFLLRDDRSYAELKKAKAEVCGG